MTGFLHRALGAFVRLFGVAVAVVGAFLSLESATVGVPLVVFGAVFALRPAVLGQILELVADSVGLLADLT
ncbi:hypothetical protein [Halorussus sp. MSC15.2]|uniref:hypothetical protein n=1 Tax=Halorussus sp. MSC15.2 TaxID=2283638 RepID=UPI0013D8A7A9|nr:hypothetical protein [Halorussus sp. MSC15.2]NEU57653.1 hypothetical protein [Halorussus sp. MSC15.2]